ncbi:MAG: translesion DNA synthesis-associated protein ImuA [Gammaproteobacteria bacterium]|nr:translesion DNA synthesis-associated protein ImuA [Gammaproteobacteria bacterium]
MSLESILQRADIWRGNGLPAADSSSLATGFPDLDALLPGGGWPQGTLTEILMPQEGVGALSIVMPALAKLSQAKRWLAWVAPPYIPYAPAMVSAGVDLSRVLLVHPRATVDGLWAVEQALRSGTCGAVLAWLAGGESNTLRRLQLAAEAGNSWGILFRPEHVARQASPAAVRLKLRAASRGVDINVIKRRGGWATGPLHLEVDRVMAMSAPAPAPSGYLHSRHPS